MLVTSHGVSTHCWIYWTRDYIAQIATVHNNQFSLWSCLVTAPNKGDNYSFEAPRYAVFSMLPSLQPSSALCSQSIFFVQCQIPSFTSLRNYPHDYL
jgi:hypothetical protein